MNQADWAYLAGFVDGDGCITAARMKGRFHPRLSMSQRDQVFLAELHQRFGVGRFWVQKVNKGEAARWVIYKGEDLHWALVNVLPFLVLKRGQAEAALRLLQDRSNQQQADKLIQLKAHRVLESR